MNDLCTTNYFFEGVKSMSKLAYQLVNAIRFQLKKNAEYLLDNEIHSCLKEIVRIMNTQKVITRTAQNNSDEAIIIRRCSEAGEKVRLIYDMLKYKYTPFTKKKSVGHNLEFQKIFLLSMWQLGLVRL